MTFEEAGQRYAALRAQYDAGRMPPADFQAAVAQLTVTDAAGAYWQMDAQTGEWLCWNGTSWVRPQQQAAAQPQASSPGGGFATPSNTMQRIWDVVGILGSGGLAYAWYTYSGMDKSVGPDKRSCIAMVVLPLLLIVLRGPLDKVLAPIQKFRQKIPPMVLVGAGLAIPFLVTNYYYSRGVSNYPLMFKSFITSTLLSYVVLRTPSPSHGGR